MLSVIRLRWWAEACDTGYECLLHESWWSCRLDLWKGNLLFEFMDALFKLLLELLLLGFSGGGSSSGSGSFSLWENGLVLSFSLGNSSLNSLVYRSLLLFLEVFGGDGPKLEQVALVVSLLSLVFLLKFISKLLFSLSSFVSELLFFGFSFFQLCF